MADLGDQLRRSIAERGLSVRATARHADCSPGYLSNVMHGRKPLTPSVAARLDRVLNTGGMLAACVLNPLAHGTATQPGNSASRRAASAAEPDFWQAAGKSSDMFAELAAQRSVAESLSVMTTADLAAPGSGREKGPAVVRNGERLLCAAELPAFGMPASWPDAAAAAAADKVVEEHAHQVETVTAVFRSWDNAYGGGLRRKAVVGQLAEVSSLLAGPFASMQAVRRLYSAAADLAQLAGWMS